MERGGEYLMLHRTKKENDENRDKWIGVGGKFEPGESPEDCLRREVREETGLTLTRWRYRGLVTFVSDVWPCEYMAPVHRGRVDGRAAPLRRGRACLDRQGRAAHKKALGGRQNFSSPARGGRAVFLAQARLPRRRADRRRAGRQAARPRIKRAGQSPAPTEAPNAPRRARDRPAGYKRGIPVPAE